MYSRIFVPVDGSDPSNAGLLQAIQLAKNQSAKIRLLHVVDEHVLDLGYCIGTYPGDVVASLRDASEKTVRNNVSLVRQFGLEPETVCVENIGDSDTASLIAEQAKLWGADLIVMGTHGRIGFKRLAKGSEAESVVRRTRIPVLLVHDESQNTPEAQKAQALAAPAPLLPQA
jgi:nucleotide-binding universal stress UspA family protein